MKACNNLKQINRESIEEIAQKRDENVKVLWKRNLFAIQTDDDLLSYLIFKVEQITRKETMRIEQQIIKDIIIESDFDKAISMRKCQEKFGKFRLEFYEQVEEVCPICHKSFCTSQFAKSIKRK